MILVRVRFPKRERPIVGERLRVIGPAAAGRWTTLRRWARATSGGRLFATGRAPPENFTLRQHAERAAALLRALAPTDLPLADAVFAGAALHRPV